MSRRHEHPSQTAREDNPSRSGNCLWTRRDAFLPGPDASVADPSSGIHPELRGKMFPINSGIVPMTAGHLPV